VEPGARRALLARRIAGTAGAGAVLPAIAVVFDAPGRVVRARNEARLQRVVPAEVVDRQFAALRRSSDADLRAEGFDEVHRLAPSDAVEVTRPKRRARSSTQTPLRR